MGKLVRWLGQDLWNVIQLGETPTPRPKVYINGELYVPPRIDFKNVEAMLRADNQQAKRNRKALRGQPRGR